jgi:CRP-like cAMP-binding protein
VPAEAAAGAANVPRTATVTAATATQLYTLDNEAFVAAVTGHAPTRTAAGRLVSDRLPADVPPAAADA